MKELTPLQVKQVYGGILPAFFAGVAIGSLAKKLYKKYKENQAAKAKATA